MCILHSNFRLGAFQASKKATILGSKGLGIPPLPLLVAPPSAARNEDGEGANTTTLGLRGQLGKDATPCDVKMFRPVPPLHPLLDCAKVPVGCALGSLGDTTKGGAGAVQGECGGRRWRSARMRTACTHKPGQAP